MLIFPMNIIVHTMYIIIILYIYNILLIYDFFVYFYTFSSLKDITMLELIAYNIMIKVSKSQKDFFILIDFFLTSEMLNYLSLKGKFRARFEIYL